MEDTMLASEFTLGLDLGDTRTKFATLDKDGNLIEEGTVLSQPKEFQRVFARFAGAVVAIEVGSQSRWSSKLLAELGLQVLIANPRQLPLIYGGVDKDDRTDAEKLARIARFDSSLLAPVTHRKDEHQHDLEILKARAVLVELRTKIVNHIRGIFKGTGIKIKSCSTDSFSSQVISILPEELSPSLKPLLLTVEELTTRIREYDKQIEALCKGKYRTEADLVCQVNGVGPITALTYLLTLGDHTRFRKSRDVGAYFGLRPRRSESGDYAPELRITRAGDRKVRSLLVQCAHYMLGPFGKDSNLRRWGLKKAEGGKKAKKRAVIAVARKLAVLLHRLLTTGEVYEPLRGTVPVVTPSAPEQIAS